MNIPFLKFIKLYYIFSIIILAVALFSTFYFGLNLGIDFVGGSIMEVEFESRPQNSAIQEKLSSLNLGDYTIQSIGEKGVVLKIKEISDSVRQNIIPKLSEISPAQELSFENISPIVSGELRGKTVALVIVSLISLLIYIMVSFRKVSRPVSGLVYGVVSIIVLTFDILITIGFFAFLGKFYNAQFSIPIVTALLTIIGYTINDKVIVFDRVRENIIKRTADNFEELVNKSLNETLIRSLSTGFCTLLVLLSLVFLGGETLKYFSLTLLIGIIVGTYSSLFVASPLLVSWYKFNSKKRTNK
jgi:preprotein translocase subunit SecF